MIVRIVNVGDTLRRRLRHLRASSGARTMQDTVTAVVGAGLGCELDLSYAATMPSDGRWLTRVALGAESWATVDDVRAARLSHRDGRWRVIRACIRAGLRVADDLAGAIESPRPGNERRVAVGDVLASSVQRAARDGESASAAAARIIGEALRFDRQAPAGNHIDDEASGATILIRAPQGLWARVDGRTRLTGESTSAAVRALLCDGLAVS